MKDSPRITIQLFTGIHRRMDCWRDFLGPTSEVRELSAYFMQKELTKVRIRSLAMAGGPRCLIPKSPKLLVARRIAGLAVAFLSARPGACVGAIVLHHSRPRGKSFFLLSAAIATRGGGHRFDLPSLRRAKERAAMSRRGIVISLDQPEL